MLYKKKLKIQFFLHKQLTFARAVFGALSFRRALRVFLRLIGAPEVLLVDVGQWQVPLVPRRVAAWFSRRNVGIFPKVRLEPAQPAVATETVRKNVSAKIKITFVKLTPQSYLSQSEFCKKD